MSRAAPSPAKLTALVGSVGTDGLYLAALEGDGVHARFFTSGAAVDEDAATGSAAGPCGAYFVERQVLPAGRVTIRQGIEMGRPSTLLVDVERAPNGVWEIHVGGGVATVGSGEFDLPL